MQIEIRKLIRLCLIVKDYNNLQYLFYFIKYQPFQKRMYKKCNVIVKADVLTLIYIWSTII